MELFNRYNIRNPDFHTLGYLKAIANILDKHDRSTPSHYHWKILKCRMIIFSNSSILACPDKNDLQQVHIVFNKLSDDYDKLVSLFLKFSLVQDGEITEPTMEMYNMCFTYTLTAKLAPTWNTLGMNYLINNRDFLTTRGPHDGVRFQIRNNGDNTTVLEVNALKINFIQSDDNFQTGEWVRVLPSLNKAVIEEYSETLPATGVFKSYKDLRRHWKNIHGYRLPEEETSYYAVRFWRGDPLTYPKLCVVRNFPIITPVPKTNANVILTKLLSAIKSRMTHFLGMPLTIQNDETISGYLEKPYGDTQVISLCTPTQRSK